MINHLLPVGSVVLLKGGIKKVVVMGIKQASVENPNTEYDYVGVMYPEGYLGSETLFLFNHDDINDVVFKGYENPEREEFIAKVEELLASDNK